MQMGFLGSCICVWGEGGRGGGSVEQPSLTQNFIFMAKKKNWDNVFTQNIYIPYSLQGQVNK